MIPTMNNCVRRRSTSLMINILLCWKLWNPDEKPCAYHQLIIIVIIIVSIVYLHLLFYFKPPVPWK